MQSKEQQLYAALLLIQASSDEHPFIQNIANKAIEEYNKHRPSENFYPGQQYQRLFNAVSESNGIPLLSELENIVQIVHEDFPVENTNPVL